jgi:hypothetical protein
MPTFDEIELGDDLPEEHPDVSMETVRRFVSPTTTPPRRRACPGHWCRAS